MLIWINFDSFAITYLIQVNCFKNFYFKRLWCVVNSLQTQKGPEISFRLHFLWNFLMKSFLLEYDINWPNSLRDGVYLFTKMYFLFYTKIFDDIMKFENLKY